MSFDALTGTLLDLARALKPHEVPLTVGGGFGLYLKQLRLHASDERMLLAELPEPRATNDIDLFIRVDILAQLDCMQRVAEALAELKFEPVANAQYFQWTRTLDDEREVKLDLLVGPLGEFRSRLKTDKPPRVRPKGKLQLHAHVTEEAVEIDTRSTAMKLEDRCTDGSAYAASIYLPQPFTYLLMKLLAFDDRKLDESKDVGRHHAMDVYRIVAMMTEAEYEETARLCRQYQGDERFRRASRVVAEDFRKYSDLGVLRIREHQLYRSGLMIEDFSEALSELFRSP